VRLSPLHLARCETANPHDAGAACAAAGGTPHERLNHLAGQDGMILLAGKIKRSATH
jgi:hypothetical protein